MYVRVKTSPNSKGKSVQIVSTTRKGSHVIQKIVRHVGMAYDDYELEKLRLLAESIKAKLEADCQELLISPEELARIKIQTDKFSDDDYKVNLKDLKEEARIVSGIHDICGTLFDEIGYYKVFAHPSHNVYVANIFKDIVLARIANPASKRASVDMLEEDFGISIDLDSAYRMMDKLDDKAVDKLQRLSYSATASLFGHNISVIFFDCSTIYFESFTEDSLKKNGWSKDKKFGQPQVLFALMVTEEGLPVGYRIFEGNRYEGSTLIPFLLQIKQKYNLENIIFVADSAMMAGYNTSFLDENKFSYIVGARLKSLPKDLKDKILDAKNYTDAEGGQIASFGYNSRRLIVSYSQERAKKDAADREAAIEAICKRLEKTTNPKDYLSSYGYKKYIKTDKATKLSLDKDKIEADSAYDGLLGVITNDKDSSPSQILSHYHNLYVVEDAFRLTKHDLALRPVFHWKPARVSAHIAICFCAYSLIKYLEYRVRLQYKKLSPEKIRQTLIRVQTSVLYDTKRKIRYGLPSKMSADARKIYDIFKIKKNLTPYIIKKL
ncbi:MAG: IS1634 family transposase [Actinobacteria bacterium]|nr:IS1634 family transposase [Actinomycetota bacterium]